MENLSIGIGNIDDLKGSESQDVWKEVTEVDILWKAYETYLENIMPFPGELPDWLRIDAGTKKPDVSQSTVSKFLKRHLAF